MSVATIRLHDQANRGLQDSLSGVAGRLAEGATAFGQMVGGVLGASLVVNALEGGLHKLGEMLIGSAEKAAEWTRHVHNFEIQSGLSAREIGGLSLQLKEIDKDFKDVQMGFRIFTTRVADAALGIGTGAKAFKDLGISAFNSQGGLKTTGQLLDQIGDKLISLPTAFERNRIGAMLFGRQALVFMPLMIEGFEEARKKAEHFGIALDPIAEKIGGEARIAFVDLSKAVEGLRLQFGLLVASGIAPLIPIITEATAAMTSQVKEKVDASRNIIKGYRKEWEDLGDRLEDFKKKHSIVTVVLKLVKEGTKAGAENAEDFLSGGLSHIIKDSNKKAAALGRIQLPMEFEGGPQDTLQNHLELLHATNEAYEKAIEHIQTEIRLHSAEAKEIESQLKGAKQLATTFEQVKEVNNMIAKNQPAVRMQEAQEMVTKEIEKQAKAYDDIQAKTKDIMQDWKNGQTDATKALDRLKELLPKAMGSLQIGQIKALIEELKGKIFDPSNIVPLPKQPSDKDPEGFDRKYKAARQQFEEFAAGIRDVQSVMDGATSSTGVLNVGLFNFRLGLESVTQNLYLGGSAMIEFGASLGSNLISNMTSAMHSIMAILGSGKLTIGRLFNELIKGVIRSLSNALADVAGKAAGGFLSGLLKGVLKKGAAVAAIAITGGAAAPVIASGATFAARGGTYDAYRKLSAGATLMNGTRGGRDSIPALLTNNETVLSDFLTTKLDRFLSRPKVVVQTPPAMNTPMNMVHMETHIHAGGIFDSNHLSQMVYDKVAGAVAQALASGSYRGR